MFNKRNVKSNGRTVVGRLSSLKNTGVQFESSLEEGLLYILTFDRDVKTYHSQPVEITYPDPKGRQRKYFPDFLVEYFNAPSVLFEVKSDQWLKRNHEEFKPKMEAGEKYASDHSWRYKLITDKEILTPYGENVRFLYRYQTHKVEPEIESTLMELLGRKGEHKVESLLENAGDNEARSLRLAALWTLVFQKKIACDLSNRLTMQTKVRIADGHFELKYPYRP